ncbi:MAG: O-antigen ligase family protein [Ktedonobacteraceae bacterium]
MLAGSVAAALSIFVVVLRPDAGIDHKTAANGWQGIFTHKNICGSVTLFLLTASMPLYFRTNIGRLYKVGYTATSILIIVMSQSRTAWIIGGLTIAWFTTIRMARRLARGERFLLAAAVLFGVALICITAAAESSSILALLGKSSTLNGRTEVWTAVMTSVLKRPCLGYKYYAFWNGLKGESGNTAIAAQYLGLANAENGILQLWLELGLIGAALLLASLIRSCRNAIKCWQSLSGSGQTEWYLLVLFLTLLALVDGDKVMYPHTIEWTLYVAADLGLAIAAKRARSSVCHNHDFAF